MYNFVITKKFLQNQNEYMWKLNKKELENFKKLKEIFSTDIFDKRLYSHRIYEKWNVKVFSSYINSKDRIIFLYKDPKKVYLYKIMEDHDYKKLLSNINIVLNDFLLNF
jgi:hypothetical protein